MTISESKKELKKYAQEDAQLAIENSTMAITDCKFGVITLNHNAGLFQAFDNMGNAITTKMNMPQIESWLVDFAYEY